MHKTILNIIGLLIVIMLVTLLLISNSRDKEIVERCNDLPECERYKCNSERHFSATIKNNYLLQYQNCLLEQSSHNPSKEQEDE